MILVTACCQFAEQQEQYARVKLGKIIRRINIKVYLLKYKKEEEKD